MLLKGHVFDEYLFAFLDVKKRILRNISLMRIFLRQIFDIVNIEMRLLSEIRLAISVLGLSEFSRHISIVRCGHTVTLARTHTHT